ncbi:uncharacterized protein BcabD6B2_46470 [Babesia caballi]|uniref:Nucleolar complex-associated protein 3 N-terminal domain-containing protein n=1 Tax=Babesia caballi TaxID=5871 RepID=A0AAV4LYA2_BABCB|nr:hypothetical protein BcabD6B2_46470 [Babesia caballi]
MPPNKPALDVKKARRKALSALKSKAPGAGPRAKTDAATRPADANIRAICTLAGYKRLVARVCTEATATPENGLGNVLGLFDVVAGRGGGTDELRAFARVLALRSLVAVAVHLIPRISYELLDEGGDATTDHAETKKSSDAKTKEPQKAKDGKQAKRSQATASSLVETERTISRQVVELRDKLVDLCSKHLNEDPALIVPLVARLAAADVRPNARLVRLCAECCSTQDEALAEVCVESLREVLQQCSIRDLEKTLKLVLKTNNLHVGVLRAVNAIPLAKRQHSFELVSDKPQASDKHVEDILSTVIAFYLRILAQCTGERLEECLTGLARFGALVNEALQREILAKMKGVVLSAASLRPSTHVRVLQAAAALSRVLQTQSQWVVQELTRMVQNTAPYLCQGQLLREGAHVQFSAPCHTRDVVRTVQVTAGHAAGSGAPAELEDLVQLVQQLVSLCLVCDAAVAQALMREVAKVVGRVPQMSGVFEAEGMVFSVLARRVTSFWELELLQRHVSPPVAEAAQALKRQAAGGTVPRPKGSAHAKAAARDVAGCGSDVYELLVADESELFSHYGPKLS